MKKSTFDVLALIVAASAAYPLAAYVIDNYSGLAKAIRIACLFGLGAALNFLLYVPLRKRFKDD
jgi:site-specific recombinase